MKHLIQTIIFCLFGSFIFAQTKTSVWMQLDATQQKSARDLKQDKSTFQLQSNDNLRPISAEIDQIGMTHHRYQQTYRGVPIEGAVLVMHEKNGLVKTANGQLVNSLDMDINPIISEPFALQTAMESMDATLFAWDDPVHENMKKEVENNPAATFYPVSELVIVKPEYSDASAEFRLAYKFDIYAVRPHTRQHVYVDARMGEVIGSVEQIHDCTDVPIDATTNYSDMVTYTGCNDSGTFINKNSKGGGMQVFDAGNSDIFFQIPTNLNDPTAVEVHWATEQFYDYLLGTFNRGSLDSSDMRLYSWVHYGDALNNAFWNGTWMTYGDGDGVTFSALTAPDVVAHEMTHGLTDFTSNLMYESESGALNESFSDIFGEVLENYARGTNDWIIGADFTVQSGKDGLRSMSNPNDWRMLTQQPDTYGGSYWVAPSGACTQLNDYCGVHFNSGVQNFWFYLLTEGGTGVNDIGENYDVSGIGMAKAADIAYYNLVYYMTPNSTFADAREGAIAAAVYLFGADSNEVNQVKAAWCAVGVGTGCIAPEPGCRYRDSLAMVEIYNALDGPNWNTPWDLTQPMNTWGAVYVNPDGCVEAFEIFEGNGEIPAAVGDLLSLNAANFWDNITGELPPEFGNLTTLSELSIIGNLSGGIPAEFGNLSDLTLLNLYTNGLSGCFDPNLQNLCEQLTIYNIDGGNNFDATWADFCASGAGACPISTNCRYTDSLSMVDILQSLDPENWLSVNFTSPIDTWSLFGFPFLTLNENGCISRIDIIDLWGGTPGEIPAELENLNELEHLHVNGNIAGNIPPELANLTNLQSIGISAVNLTGGLPAELGNMPNLTSLAIYGGLSGCFDPNLQNLCGQASVNVDIGNNFEAIWADFCTSGQTACGSYSTCRERDSLALVDIYNEANITLPWNLNEPMSTWSGVSLYSVGCVRRLDITHGNSFNNLSESVGNLENLQHLASPYNELSTLPQSLSSLNNLEGLDIRNNQFTVFPDVIGDIPNLKTLLIGENQITSLPASIGNITNLEYLSARTNSIANISSQIGNLTQLWMLDLCENNLTTLPTEIGNLSKLTTLRVCNNQLTNLVPEVGNLTQLTSLDLCGNNLTTLPTQIGNLSKLFRLEICNNQLTSLVPEIGNLTELFLVYAQNNQLSTLPTSIANLSNLSLLYINGNNFTTLPSHIGNLGSLTALSANDNQLTNIPPEIGNLINLNQLYLQGNQLTEDIFDIISNLNGIQRLNVSDNQLSGNIPFALANMNSLSELYLNDNNLSGCYDESLINLCTVLSNSSNTNISDGNNFDAPWEDFCNTGAGTCNGTVLPGDFNNNGTANINDFLYWGLNYGKIGPTRPNATTNWVEQEALNWSSSISDINSKHADADGNGIIDESDKNVLDTNYGFSSNPLPDEYEPSPVMFSLVPIDITYPSLGISETTYELRLQGNTTVSVHGITATFDISDLISDTVTPQISIEFPDIQSLQPDYGIWDDTYLKSEGSDKLHIGMTKTDGIDITIDGPIAFVVIYAEDIQSADPICIIEGGNLISSLGEVTPVMGSFQQNISSALSVPASLIVNPAQCGANGSAMIEVDETVTCTYAWSNGEGGTSINNLAVGNYDVSITCPDGTSSTIDFTIDWAYTPVAVTASTTQICFDFENAPLAEPVQVSFGDGVEHLPITIDTCYTLPIATYDVTIWNVNTLCPVDLGSYTVNPGPVCRSAARFTDAKTGQIAGRFTRFAGDEFIKNFIRAEKTYIRHRSEIHRILESKEARYQSVNANFDIIKEMAMDALFQSFVRGNSLQINEEHLQAIDKFLLSLNAATNKSALQNEITKVRQHLHVMQGKELKNALIAFDRAGGLDDASFISVPTDENNDILEVQLLNTLGRESRMTYQTYQSGSHQIELYNINGQYIRSLQNSHINAGQHELIITKDELTSGIYFIRIKFISESGLTSDKVLKLPAIN